MTVFRKKRWWHCEIVVVPRHDAEGRFVCNDVQPCWTGCLDKQVRPSETPDGFWPAVDGLRVFPSRLAAAQYAADAAAEELRKAITTENLASQIASRAQLELARERQAEEDDGA